ncbi:MAG: hypothetical protein KJ558_01625 [Gammaproteobacteria bacterium]|nr:hypothetical protein [Gammaproteobacteria bacterium]MBU1653537.1 hypothetical protein [Gammaproteobacteria bacterium]MBU1961879.1 hypothetical protein [Gammaproteobacteria bacterium]
MIQGIKGLLSLTALLVAIGMAGGALAGQFRFHDKPNFVGVTLEEDWCGEVVALKLTALQDPGIFDPPDSEYMQRKALGTSRAALEIVCPGVRKITFSGWYRGELYYAGAASAGDDWRLVGLYAAP